MPGYLTLEEAAERLGVEYKTVYRLVRSGEIPAGKVGRIYRIREDDLEAYFDRQKQLMAQQAARSGPIALERRSCGACRTPILSELSTGGACAECGKEICQACWTIKKLHRCDAHADAGAGDARVPGASDHTGSVFGDVAAERPVESREAVIERLRAAGRPVVSSEDAALAEQAFIRAFSQRLEVIEELPDPLNKRVISLRAARVKHVVESMERTGAGGPANVISRFTLRAGGWGKPKAALVLEARFMTRPQAFFTNGYDADPLGEAELSPALAQLRARSQKVECFHVVLFGSPTGWSEAAIRMIARRDHGRSFHDRRVGVALFDLHNEKDQLDHTDERLWAFWPLLAPVRFEREVSRCVSTLSELAEKLENVSLEYAAKICSADESWVRAAFNELKKTGKFMLEKLPNIGLVLLRRGL